MTILVAAVLSVCLTAMPGTCEEHHFHIERKACGLHFKAEVPVQGGWQEADAKIECGGHS